VKPLRIRLSEVAANDILEQADWYEQHSSRALAKRWGSAVTSALIRAARRPDTGAPCQFSSDELRGVRHIPIARFPKHLIFYKTERNEVLILRVIHGARDLERLF
jgi:toxin ParE1/3/4